MYLLFFFWVCGEEITLTRGPFLGIPRSLLTDHVALVSIIILHYSSSQSFGLSFADAFLGFLPRRSVHDFFFRVNCAGIPIMGYK